MVLIFGRETLRGTSIAHTFLMLCCAMSLSARLSTETRRRLVGRFQFPPANGGWTGSGLGNGGKGE